MSQYLYEFGPYRLDATRRLLWREGQAVALTPKCLEILLALVESPGEVVSKESLMQRVWPDSFVEEGNLTYNISMLRKALGEQAGDHQYIITAPGRGYRFVSVVTEVSGEGAETGVAAPGLSPLEESGTAKTEQGQSAADQRGLAIPRASVAWPHGWRLRLVLAGLSTLLVGLGAAAYYIWTKPAAPALKILSVAVLPFKPLVADSRDEVLEMGIADTLITRLNNLKQITVRPISAVRRYTALDQDAVAAGRELHVQAVLEGSIQKAEGKVRVTARLVQTADGKPLWTRQFDEQWTNIFAVQDAISERVAADLRGELSGEEQRRVTRHYTENIEAYQLYLKGRYFQDKRTPEGWKRGRDYFQQATEKDPNYALAFAGLADCYVALAARADMPPQDSSQKAKAAVMRALELDDTIAEAHASLANIRYRYDWDWAGAESEFKRAFELNPNYSLAYQNFASYLIAMGRHQDAISEIKRAQELEPLSVPLNVQMARVLYFAREYDKGIEQCQKALEMDPDFGGAHLFLGRSYKQKGMYKEALVELEKASDLFRDNAEVWSLIGYTYGVSGRRVEAQKVLHELQAQSKQGYVSPYHVAMVYAGLGERDEALSWLEKAYEDREGRMTILKSVPEFDSLRADPRFAALLSRVGLSP